MALTPYYKRVLLKISGEGLCKEGGFGLEAVELETIAKECVDVAKMGVQGLFAGIGIAVLVASTMLAVRFYLFTRRVVLPV